MNESFVQSIVEYGTRYRQEMLGKYDPDKLLSNWWLALDFFFARVCFQGRRDDVSERVYQRVVDVLSPMFGGTEGANIYQQERSRDWETIRQQLEMRIGKGKVGKGGDIKMVLSALEFIERLPSLNIVGYSIQEIRSGDISNHYDELQDIFQVGPKIAAFYLRDLVSLYQLENRVPEQFAFCLQPIDVWVRKLVKKIRLVDDKASDEEAREAIIALCRKHNVSPAQFNQGAWYLGYFAFDLVLEMLLKKADVTPSSS